MCLSIKFVLCSESVLMSVKKSMLGGCGSVLDEGGITYCRLGRDDRGRGSYCTVYTVI